MLTTERIYDKTDYTVAEIALNFPQSIKILQRYNLDYCCNGKKPFVKACEKANIDSDTVWQEILMELPFPGGEKRMRFHTWEPGLLIDFILQHHHAFVRQTIPQIEELLTKVVNVHGQEEPELKEIKYHFDLLAEELLEHLPKEEEVLFPAIRRILSGSPIDPSPIIQNIDAPIVAMEHEHESAGELIKLIRRMTRNYMPPAHACPTYQMTFKLLEEFDMDLMQHIHLENNILFQKIRMTT